jgi:3-deoxy-D-manno-octulosonic-acid transferase
VIERAWRLLTAIVEPFAPAQRLPSPAEVVAHGASAGEVGAAIALATVAQDGADWLITTGTEAGMRVGAARRLPRDLPRRTDRFLVAARPRALLLIEADLWPNLLAAAAARRIPVGVAGARMTARAFRRFRLVPRFARDLLGRVVGFACATSADAERLDALGARNVTVTGFLKAAGPAIARLGPPGDTVRVLFGSAHPGEVRSAAAALAGTRIDPRRSAWTVVPRHAGDAARLRRECDSVAPGIAVDGRFGVLGALWGTCDVGIVGGGLGRGVHDLFAPLRAGLRPMFLATGTIESGAPAELTGAGLAVPLGRTDANEAVARALVAAPPWPELLRRYDGRVAALRYLAGCGVPVQISENTL